MIDMKFKEFSTTLGNISSKLKANTECITDAEHRISAVEDDMSAELESKVRTLTEKCTDLEGRSRRDNILIYNLKEDTEGRQPVSFFERWLPALLGLESKWGVIKIDRAHRSLGPPRPDRPRAVIKLHHSRDTSRILAAARKQAPLTYEGQTVFIRQDMTAAVKEMRQLKEVRFSMQYPAVLSFMHEGKTRSFRSPKDALAFLNEMNIPNDHTKGGSLC
uniref:L1 transposable element RRM domain-containing protein n=1 Tax=Poecilia formosa TaxID=48698 RepID=A0A087XJ32_POEFO